jgi:hypothetical protein
VTGAHFIPFVDSSVATFRSEAAFTPQVLARYRYSPTPALSLALVGALHLASICLSLFSFSPFCEYLTHHLQKFVLGSLVQCIRDSPLDAASARRLAEGSAFLLQAFRSVSLRVKPEEWLRAIAALLRLPASDLSSTSLEVGGIAGNSFARKPLSGGSLYRWCCCGIPAKRTVSVRPRRIQQAIGRPSSICFIRSTFFHLSMPTHQANLIIPSIGTVSLLVPRRKEVLSRPCVAYLKPYFLRLLPTGRVSDNTS